MEPQAIVSQSYPVRLRNQGQLTLPPGLRRRFDVADGNFLVVAEIAAMVFLSPKPLQVPRLADKLADMIDEAGVTLADLLKGLEDERIASWKERAS